MYVSPTIPNSFLLIGLTGTRGPRAPKGFSGQKGRKGSRGPQGRIGIISAHHTLSCSIMTTSLYIGWRGPPGLLGPPGNKGMKWMSHQVNPISSTSHFDNSHIAKKKWELTKWEVDEYHKHPLITSSMCSLCITRSTCCFDTMPPTTVNCSIF